MSYLYILHKVNKYGIMEIKVGKAERGRGIKIQNKMLHTGFQLALYTSKFIFSLYWSVMLLLN